MFELYQDRNASRGSIAEVYINRDQRLVKKIYKLGGITIAGTPPVHTTQEEVDFLFHNEIEWCKKLKSDRIVNLLDYGTENNEHFLVQEYHGPDLLYYNDRYNLKDYIPDLTQQIVDMFCFFKEHNLYKFNNAMCNLTLDADKRIRAFDFKYAANRTVEKAHLEYYSVDTWIVKLDPMLPQLLREQELI